METSPIPVLTVQTAPFDDQRPGTSGLRRKTAVFEGKKNYLQNYIQSLLSSIDLRDRQGCTMVVGSDGRYFSRAAIEVIVQMAAANGVRMGEGRGAGGLLDWSLSMMIIRTFQDIWQSLHWCLTPKGHQGYLELMPEKAKYIFYKQASPLGCENTSLNVSNLTYC